MPSALDQRIDTVIATICGPGGQLPLTTIEQHGVTLPMIASAPPTLGAYFMYFCHTHGDAEFLVDGDERLTFRQAIEAASAVAGALVADFGVGKGDRVGIAARNASSWVVVYMGVLMAGGVATLLNGWWQGRELAAGIADVGAKLVIADVPRAARIAEHADSISARVVTIDVGLPLDEALRPLLAGGGRGALPEVGPDDLATILFTSGSTGQSKGACSTHRAVVQGTFNYLAQGIVQLTLGTQDGVIGPDAPPPAILLNVPLFHVTGEVPMMLVSFAAGRKIVLMPKWDVVHAMQLIERERVTNFTGVPLMSWEILNHPERDKYDLSSVQAFAAGGAPRPPEHVRRLTEELPAPPALGYGLTETNAVGCGTYWSNYADKPNSTGPATKPLVELAILDDEGKSLPQGQRGEVGIRSVANFSGYWNNPVASAACMTAGGYFRTGDVGYLDEDGYLFIVDRKKDIIIRGGENISCQEVEAAIYAHAAVAEAAVFGLPDERFGELVGAVVHYHDGEHVSDEALRFFLGERLAAFKVPARLWTADDALPRLGTEKIDKVTLRAAYRQLHAQEAGEAAAA